MLLRSVVRLYHLQVVLSDWTVSKIAYDWIMFHSLCLIRHYISAVSSFEWHPLARTEL